MSLNSCVLVRCCMCCIYLIIWKTPPATLIRPPPHHHPNTSIVGYSSSVIRGLEGLSETLTRTEKTLQTESGFRANKMQQSGIYHAG